MTKLTKEQQKWKNRDDELKNLYPAITPNDEIIKDASTNDFDVFYISYDEPNAEENWSNLISKIPWAKRIHGIKGFDEAHKHAARQSDTMNFITIDGDNKIDEDFFNQSITYNPNYVYSWAGKNHINGLIYGNGGIKLWPKGLVLHMNTHEHTDDDEAIEFCWKLPYFQMNDWYSVSYNNTTPFQAFRVGFREGVKLSLHEGKQVEDMTSTVWHGNLKRLKIWMSVGADVKNGIYAIYGARLGCYLTNVTDFDISQIADYEWFDKTWREKWVKIIEDQEAFKKDYNRLVDDIRNEIGLDIVNLGKQQSKFFKSTIENPAKMGLIVSETAATGRNAKFKFKDKNI